MGEKNNKKKRKKREKKEKKKRKRKKKNKKKTKNKKKKKKKKFFPLPSKTMGCFSGRLMSAARDQKLFCKLCSPFCCSFNEFVEEKVITPSYSSAILSLLFNMLSRLVIAFLPRIKHLLISWLQSPSAVILEPKKIKYLTVSIVFPSICHGMMGLDASKEEDPN